MQKVELYQYHKIPQWILNIQLHMETAFSPWFVKSPTTPEKISRSFVFFFCTMLTAFMPEGNLLYNGIGIVFIWIVLGFIPKKLPYFIPLLFIMLNIGWLYYIMQLFIPYY